jgi:hypothetical protein
MSNAEQKEGEILVTDYQFKYIMELKDNIAEQDREFVRLRREQTSGD